MTVTRNVIAVDLGKSRCRVVMTDPARRVIYEGIGAPGLASPTGVEAALESIMPMMAHVDAHIAAVSVGAAGAWAAPDQAAELARRLADAVGAPTVVTSDVVTAHAGALGGGEGVLLIAGTGAAGLGIDADGAKLVDGWGPDLGDFGSGSWLGREALRAVLREASGLGPRTALTDSISGPVGNPSDILAWLANDGPLPRRLATLAPLVLEAAANADGAASAIVAEGIRLLTATATAAAAQSRDVAVHGGLTSNEWFRSALELSLGAAGCRVIPAAGDALEGARLVAERFDLPHERFLHRAE